VTATGVDTAIHPFGIAVPRQLLHSRITVPGYGTFEADDTGGDMNKDWRASIIHVDVRFKTHAEALQWGKQLLTITIAQ
jgi:3D (Asp-Asp-Asp) domain-containing protein